jgi:tRNA pseudouridine55 synthase
MNGILIIDKPAGITSHDVVSRVRRILKTKRVGHTGTLDPFATGVMVILVGQATRLAQFLDKDEKEYEANVRFGFETDTGDRTGSRIADCGLRNEEIAALLGRIDWDDIFDDFRGEIQQTPPMYSAKKVDGKKLYEHARKGQTIDRKSIKVWIHQLELLESAIRNPQSAIYTIRIHVVCSAGTYIRTLAEDIGRKLGVGAHLSELRRTRAGKFDISQSVTLEQLADFDDPNSELVAMEDAVSHVRSITLSDERVAKTRNGLSTRIDDQNFGDGEAVQMVDSAGQLIAIGFFNAAENTVQPKVVLV